MKKTLFFTTVYICSIVFCINLVLSAEQETCLVKYPEGYRGWTHIKSMVIQKGHPMFDSFGGIHHIYANDEVLKALKDGNPYPDGSIIVFDLLEAENIKNAIVEGKRKIVGVMQKNAEKFTDTGGWGFEGFKGDTKQRVVNDPHAECFNCHKSQKIADYVFSKYRP